jgi:hypothetical protein
MWEPRSLRIKWDSAACYKDKFTFFIILKIVQTHIEERGMLNGNQCGFRARYRTSLQCVRHTDHLFLNFNSNMYTAAVFLDTEKVFDRIRQLSLLSSSFCWWHLYICDRPQRVFCSQKAAARSQFYRDVVWALEHKISEYDTQTI